jgi:hypothetical protein
LQELHVEICGEKCLKRPVTYLIEAQNHRLTSSLDLIPFKFFLKTYGSNHFHKEFIIGLGLRPSSV